MRRQAGLGRAGSTWGEEVRKQSSPGMREGQEVGVRLMEKTKEGSGTEQRQREAARHYFQCPQGPAGASWASLFPSLACLFIWKT